MNKKRKPVIKHIVIVEQPIKIAGYNVVKLANELMVKKEQLTNKKLVELVRSAGSTKMLVVKTHMGSTITHVEKSQTTGRFTGYNERGVLISFHPNNVKSYFIAVVTPVLVPTIETDENFRYF